MAYARFTEIPWANYKSRDEFPVFVANVDGPYASVRRKLALLPRRRWVWDMKYRYNLKNDGADQRATIDAFLVQARALAFDPFLLNDPKDFRRSGISLGTGDASQTVFFWPTTPTSEQFREFPYDDSSTVVTVNAVNIATANRTIDTDARKVTLAVAPGAGHSVVAAYDWYRLVSIEGNALQWDPDEAPLASTAPDFVEIIRD